MVDLDSLKTIAKNHPMSLVKELAAEVLRQDKLLDALEDAERLRGHQGERVAQITAHRACCGSEHDPDNGKLHGFCVVCGVPWPCEYAGTPPTRLNPTPETQAAPVYQWRSKRNSEEPWHDSTYEEAYSRVDDHYEGRTLYTAPPAKGTDPDSASEVTRLRKLLDHIAFIVQQQKRWQSSTKTAVSLIDRALKQELEKGIDHV